MREKRNTWLNWVNAKCAQGLRVLVITVILSIGVSELKRKIPQRKQLGGCECSMCSFHCESALTRAVPQALITSEKFCCTLGLIEG
jgi:hypothetical protein